MWIVGHANVKMQVNLWQVGGWWNWNGSQKVNNYVVFPRVSMIIPATHSRFFYTYFPHRWQQNFQTFGAVNNTTLNSFVKIKMIWLYQRVPDIRHGIFDLIFCRITPQIRVPTNRNHFSTERNCKKEKVEHILLRRSCYIKPLSLVKIPPPFTWIFFQINLTELVRPSKVKYYSYCLAFTINNFRFVKEWVKGRWESVYVIWICGFYS